MDERPESKSMSASKISIAQLMQPEHANNLGNVHGGWIMKLVDEAGALACMRHAQRRVVTVSMDRMVFKQPIRIGDLVILDAEVSYTGRTSMEAKVHVTAENPITGERTHTNTAYLVYVALDRDGNPAQVPALYAETDEEEERMQQARVRQEYRLSQIKNER
jgi:uncharacterized protein (TIGR00369 family)